MQGTHRLTVVASLWASNFSTIFGLAKGEKWSDFSDFVGLKCHEGFGITSIYNSSKVNEHSSFVFRIGKRVPGFKSGMQIPGSSNFWTDSKKRLPIALDILVMLEKLSSPRKIQGFLILEKLSSSQGHGRISVSCTFVELHFWKRNDWNVKPLGEKWRIIICAFHNDFQGDLILFLARILQR